MLEPADMGLWQGRRDDLVEGELGRRWHQQVAPWQPGRGWGQGRGLALLGFACDVGVQRNLGRPGAGGGPNALRRAMAGLPYRGPRPLWDAGTVAAADGRLEEAQEAYAAQVAALLADGQFPLGLGGGHEIAYGSFQGLLRALPEEERHGIGIVNLDAHFDLRGDAVPSSGTPFRQIADDCAARGLPFRYCCLGVSEAANTAALFARARALGVEWMRDEEMDLLARDRVLARLGAFLDGVRHVYLTICLDVLPAAVAPGVSAPASRGVPLEVVEPLVDAVAASGKLRVADIAELNPDHDVDGRTARVAARLAYRLAGAGTA
ncbi:MAG TPA: formimidoylglutamase [Azospirillaceae bacterium]|nr:formimidoylglutamase [Azospirillaceae bacterium]